MRHVPDCREHCVQSGISCKGARSWNYRCLPSSTCVLEVSDIDVGKQMAAYTYDLLVELRDSTHRFVLLGLV